MSAVGKPVGVPAPAWMQRDPTLDEERRLLWEMTAAERVTAMRAGRLSPRQLSMWASRRPREVPVLNGEFEFIAMLTPEVAEA
ncbi:MAG: hypothetical protein M3389_05295 [Actinomycetota bacterium]|nr:hypothetical protein [Actinomycetota bacterium]